MPDFNTLSTGCHSRSPTNYGRKRRLWDIDAYELHAIDIDTYHAIESESPTMSALKRRRVDPQIKTVGTQRGWGFGGFNDLMPVRNIFRGVAEFVDTLMSLE